MSKVRPLVAAAGLLLIAFIGTPGRAHATPVISSNFTLDGVSVTVNTAFMPGPAFTVAKPGAVDQTAVSSTVRPYRNLMLETMPFGTSSPGEGLPVATPGEAPGYRDALRSQRHAEGGAPQAAPAIDLFGSTTPGTMSQVLLAVTASGKVPVAVAEWVVQAGSRLWILRADEELGGGVTTSSFGALLAATSVTSNGVSATPGPSPSGSPAPAATPSTSPSAAPSVSPSPAPTPSATPSVAPSSLPTPTARTTADRVPVASQSTGTNAPWWSGVCDVGHNGDGYPLGAVFQGFAACGPRPFTESPAASEDYLVQFYPGAWGEYEFECVELAMRYMYLTYGIDPYPANGNQVVTNYSGSSMVRVANGTAGQAPQPGDVISFGADTADGHAAVVTASAVNSSGNGSITVIEENNSAGGSDTLTVSGWVVGPDAYPTIGWLHHPGSGGPTVGVDQSSGQQYVFWQAQDGGLWEDHGAHAVWAGPMTLNMGLLGSSATVGVKSDGEEDVFWRGTEHNLWEGVWSGNRWSGPYDIGPGFNLSSQPAVGVNESLGQEYVFWQGTGGGLWEDFWNGSSWIGPISLGMGILGSAPTVAVQANGEEDVYWRGTEHNLWEAFWANGRWNGPIDIGPGYAVSSQPSVAANRSLGQEYVFWQGTGDGLWEDFWTGSSWIGPISLGMGPLGSAPTAGVQANGEEDVYWRGTNSDLWEASWAHSRWNGPSDAGPGFNLSSQPSVGVNPSLGQEYVFWQGAGGGLGEGWEKAGSWSGPAALSMGTLGSPPGAGVQSSGQVDVFWAGTNADLWGGYSSGSGWDGPYDRGHGWNLNSAPAVAVMQSSGRQDVFWQGSDGGLWTSSGSGSTWTAPASLHMGSLGSAPGAGVQKDGEDDVFWRGAGGDMWEAFSVSGHWYGPYDEGPGWDLSSQPAVAVNQANGQVYVFWEGPDGGLWEGYWTGAGWDGPMDLGMGPLGSAPAAGVQADGEEDVFWRGTNGDLWEALWANGRWNGPYDQGPAWNQ